MQVVTAVAHQNDTHKDMAGQLNTAYVHFPAVQNTRKRLQGILD